MEKINDDEERRIVGGVVTERGFEAERKMVIVLLDLRFRISNLYLKIKKDECLRFDGK